MKDWQYIGDEKRIRALRIAEEIAVKYIPLGITVTEDGVVQLARFLFPEAFREMSIREFQILAEL